MQILKVMKKFLKIASLVFVITLFLSSLTCAVVFLTPPKTKLDEKKLVQNANTIEFYDKKDRQITVSSGKAVKRTKKEFSALIKNAFVSVEDKNFYKHGGIDLKRMIKAFLVNVKNFSFKQGASTITQQLIKNTHLTSEKTLTRKIDEIKLAVELEKRYTKDQIITMYLNTIYFGENTFGLYDASLHYFSAEPESLSVAQTATLAGIISAPSKLNPNINPDLCLQKRNKVINAMYRQGYIDEKQKNVALNEKLSVTDSKVQPYEPYVKACVNEIETDYGISPYTLKHCKVLTYYNEPLQNELSDFKTSSDYQAIVLDNKNSGVEAYYSTASELERDIASVGKPLYVYAPAIEENFLTKYTYITDEPTDFGGYKPKNYGNKYYGKVTFSEALQKSLNVPAVKILDSIGVKTAEKYANKLGLTFENKGLSVALGNLGKGVKIKNLAAAYATFANFGQYKKPHFIRKIILDGKILYRNDDKSETVFSPSTASVINDVLKETAKFGTAKRLSYLDFEVCAKTGTNGIDENNFDCYSVGYTTDSTVSVWLGNKDNSPVNNETGSKTPTALVGKYLSYMYSDSKPDDFEDKGLVSVPIDKISYEDDGNILLADDNAPKKYVVDFTLPEKSVPKAKSTRFSSSVPFDAEVSVNKNEVSFKLDLPDYVTVVIYRFDGKTRKRIYEGNEDFSDVLPCHGVYDYYAVFSIHGKTTVLCPETKLKSVYSEKEKVVGNDADDLPDRWWEN